MHRLSTIIAFIQLSYLKILLFELTETHTDIITYHLPRIKRLWSYDELINYAQEVSHSKNLQYSPLDLDNIVKFSQGSKEKLNEAIVNDYLSSLANKSSPASNYAGEALTAVSSNFTVIASVIVLFAISATATMALFYTYSWLFPVGLWGGLSTTARLDSHQQTIDDLRKELDAHRIVLEKANDVILPLNSQLQEVTSRINDHSHSIAGHSKILGAARETIDGQVPFNNVTREAVRSIPTITATINEQSEKIAYLQLEAARTAVNVHDSFRMIRELQDAFPT